MMTLTSILWNRRLVFSAAVSAPVLALAVLAGCVTAPKTGDVPDWLSVYPNNPDWYIGIGGSDTGNQADDRAAAAAAARADLAAQISTAIASELDVSSGASSQGFFEESVKSTVTESVEENLKSVETVDTWFSADRGVWAYVRLSKDVWASIIEGERADLAERVRGILEPVAEGGMNLPAETAALGRARKILLSSPWGLSLRDDILGSSGFLIDSVDSAISERMGSLSIRALTSSRRISYGTQAVLVGDASFGASGEIGSIPLVITGPAGMKVMITTDPEGSFKVTLPTEKLPPGAVRFEIAPDLSAWGIPDAGFPTSSGSAELLVAPVLLAVSVDSSASPDLRSMDGSVGDWISGLELPVETVSPGNGEADLRFSWTVFDFPRSEKFANAPYMAKVGAVLTVSRGGNVLFIRNIDPVKDGGLDYEQARVRSAEAFLNALAENETLTAELTEALGL